MSNGQTGRSDASEEMAKRLGWVSGNKPSGAEKPPQAKDPLDEALEMKKKAFALRQLDMGAPQQETGEPVLIQGLKIMQTIVESALTRTAELTTKTTSEGTRSELDGITRKLESLEAKLSNPQNPLQTYREVGMALTEMAEQLRPKETSGVQVSGGDIRSLLELKSLEIDREDKRRTHDREMEELRHRWEVERADGEKKAKDEDRRFWARFRQETQREREEARLKQRALGELEDLAGAVKESIKKARGVAAPGAFQRECPTCGEILDIQKGQKEVECPTCGGLHEIKWPEEQKAPET